MRRTALLAVILCWAGSVHAQKEGLWQVRGTAESAFTYGFGLDRDLGLRQFDIHNRQPRLINGRLLITYRDLKSNTTLTLEPWVGDSADLLYRTEPSDSAFAHSLGQAYVTLQSKSGLTVDLGKFTSWIGYESALAVDGEFQSRGLLYTLAQPVYHGGLRFSVPLSNHWTISGYGTQGWNQVERSTSGLTIGSQIRYQRGAIGATLGAISGREGSTIPNRAGSFGGIGFSNPGSSQVDLIDLILTFDPDQKTHYALNADLGFARHPNSGRWHGVSLVAKRILDGQNTIALRAEWVGDPDGVRSGASTSLYGATVTLDHQLSNAWTLRLEGRSDSATALLFGDTGGTRRNQSSLSLGLLFKF